MVNSGFISNDALNARILRSCRYVYNLLVEKNEDYYTPTDPTSLVVPSGSSSISLGSDFLKLRGVDRQLDSGGGWSPVRRYQFQERGRFTGYPQTRYLVPVYYRLLGNNLKFLPEENAPGNYRAWIIPQFVDFPDDTTDYFDAQGYEELAIIDCAIKCLNKEESSVRDLQARKAEILNDINRQAQVRDYGEGDRIVDVLSSIDPEMGDA